MLLENLRSKLTWLDVLVGLAASILIAAILIGFRFQTIPEYKAEQIADQDVRAIQDVTYEDKAATELKRSEATARVPALYQLESDQISANLKLISEAFLAQGKLAPISYRQTALHSMPMFYSAYGLPTSTLAGMTPIYGQFLDPIHGLQKDKESYFFGKWAGDFF